MSQEHTAKVFLVYMLIMTGGIFVAGLVMAAASIFSLITGRVGSLQVQGCAIGAVVGLFLMCFAGFILCQVRKGQM